MTDIDDQLRAEQTDLQGFWAAHTAVTLIGAKPMPGRPDLPVLRRTSLAAYPNIGDHVRILNTDPSKDELWEVVRREWADRSNLTCYAKPVKDPE